MKISIVIATFVLISSTYCRKIRFNEFPAKPLQPVDPFEEKTLKTSCTKLSHYNQEVFGGYMEVGEKLNSALYYVFYTAKNKDENAPIIMWLQGGPGCSSMLGAFTELGPYELKCTNGTDCMEQARLTSWNDKYHLLVVDQPVGTGYSYGAKGELVNSTEMAADYLYNGLVNLFKLGSSTDCNFAKYTNNKFHVFGESAAGHWIPGIAYKILKENEKASFKINLISIGMGDPWIDPVNQNENGLFAFTLGLINEKERQEVEILQLRFVSTVQNEAYELANDLADQFLDVIIEGGGGVNVYNYRIFGNYDDQYVVDYLNSTQIKTKYQVPSYIDFDMCNGTVYLALLKDNVLSQAWKMPYIFSKIPVMLYNGQDDITCNTAGQVNWINKLDWPGHDEFFHAPNKPWTFNGTVVGMEKEGGGLKFVVVNKAGHMVPMDQIENSVEMLDRWFKGL